jgi:hypothetical protein
MTNFRRLPGLPAYGPLATAFPPEWGSHAREGLVVELVANDGEVWVGNFQPGLGGVNDVLRHPNGRDALVISNGTLWSVNPTTRNADELAPAVFDVWPVADPDGYVLNEQDLAFLRLSATWHSLEYDTHFVGRIQQSSIRRRTAHGTSVVPA